MATEDGGSGFNIHPMDQFVVKPLFGGTDVHWYTITNVTLWMAVTVAAVAVLLVFLSRGRALVPTRGQSVAELIYGFTHKMVEDVAGKEGLKSFSTTSHIAVTAVLALAVFFTVTAIGFMKHGMGFLGLFWVSSAPLPLRPVLAVIEVISYFVRPVSHSIRLAGNLMAGHAVLKVFAGFAGALGVGAVLPIGAITAIYGLELLVACIQAYVFTILTCVYLHDALHPSH